MEFTVADLATLTGAEFTVLEVAFNFGCHECLCMPPLLHALFLRCHDHSGRVSFI